MHVVHPLVPSSPASYVGFPATSHPAAIVASSRTSSVLATMVKAMKNKLPWSLTKHGHTPSNPIDPTWYMDTGATHHLTGEMGKLTGEMGKLSTQEPYRGHDQVHTANAAGMHISHVGQASLLTSNHKSLHLRNVLGVPSGTCSLLSVPQLTRDNNVFTKFHHFYFFLSRIGTRGTFCLEVACAMDFMHLIWRLPSSFQWCPCAAHWHAQLGHPATPIVRSILHRHDLPVASNKDVATVCDACQQGKSHQLPFSESRHVVKTPLELVFSDVWGHAQTSVGDHNYYVSFIDAYSRFT